MKAELYYSDNTVEEFVLPFSPEIDNEWQFANMPIIPGKKLDVEKILVYCMYNKNVGTAYFDNLSLTREPAQTMKYDDNGELVSVATDGISEDVNTYSGGNLTKTVTSGNGTFNYTYDTKHNLLTATNGAITQTNTYNTTGNVTKTVLSGTGTTEKITTSASYTSDGNYLSVYTDMLGSTHSAAYTNPINKMYGVPSSNWNHNNIQMVYSYRNDGMTNYQLLRDKNTKEEFVRLTYVYDARNRMTSITRTGASASQVYSLNYNDFNQLLTVAVGTKTLATNTYNSSGALTKQTFGNGDYVSYTYDHLGRLKTSTTESDKDVVYAYTPEGQLASVTADDTLRYDYLYDSLGRLIRSSRHDDGDLILEIRHQYDDSNRLSKQYINLIDRLDVVGYTYNSKGLLSTMTHDWLPDLSYSYDAL